MVNASACSADRCWGCSATTCCLPHYATDPGEWVEFTQRGAPRLPWMVWMAGWWLTEAVDIEATALLPIGFPLLGIAPFNKSCRPTPRR